MIPKKIEHCYPGIQLSVIKNKNETISVEVVSIIVQYTIDMLGRDWPVNIKIMLAKQILENFWHLTIEEIAMCLNRAAFGDFQYTFGHGDNKIDGKIYGQASPFHIILWLRIYDASERTTFWMQKNLSHKEPYEKQFDEERQRETQSMRSLIKQQTERYKSIEEAQKKVFDNKKSDK